MKKSLLRLGLVACFTLGTVMALAQKTDPKPITTPSPGYPDALTDTGLSGSAEVDITVKADGSVANPTLAMATHRAFGRAAIAVVTSWKFQPGMQDGVPVERQVSVPFRFSAPVDQVINAGAKRKVFIALPEPALSQKDFGGKLKVKRNARPIYPRTLAGSDIEEKIQVNFVVTPDGATVNPTVVGAKHKELEIPAIQAVAQMSYEPPMKDSKPVYVEATITLRFADERPEFGGGGGGGNRGGGGGSRGGGGGGGGRGGG